MTEILEGVQPPAAEQEEKRDDKKVPIKVRCIMLFDGTMNNKTNIQSRIDRDEFYKKTISLWSKIKRDPKGEDSYENGFTNIAALDTYMAEEPAEGYDITVLVYTEGAGTINHKNDKTLGYAIGMGKAGVKNKCEKGINDAIQKIMSKKLNGKDISPESHFIKKLTIDVFGFSRGATTARYCIHRLLLDERQPISKRLNNHGMETKEVEVCFAGLFDTVSSHGVSFENDVRALELDAVVHAKKTLHLVAADEYRKNFSLTDIKSTGAKGEEYFLPGAHSDVGGSYHDDTAEHFYLTSGSPADVKADRNNLISEGWYKDSEIIYEEYPDESGHFTHARTKANRAGVRNAYCQIPLKIMAKSAKEQGLAIKATLETDANQSISKFPELQQLDVNIDSYKVRNLASYRLDDPLLKIIRNTHLHMSSKDVFGLTPRFSSEGGKRTRRRKIHNG